MLFPYFTLSIYFFFFLSVLAVKHSGCFYLQPVSTLTLSLTHWVQNVTRRGIFFNSSRWYRVTILPIFLFIH